MLWGQQEIFTIFHFLISGVTVALYPNFGFHALNTNRYLIAESGATKYDMRRILSEPGLSVAIRSDHLIFLNEKYPLCGSN